jgi:predicted nucleic acid-binding protein
MKLAYVDACVWITLVEGLDDHRPPIRAALAALSHEGWEFCTSDAVRLEVLFRPLRSENEVLSGIYRSLLENNRSLGIPRTVFADALNLATSEGLKAMDAVHCAIANHHGCERFVTTDPHFNGLKAISPLCISLTGE